MFVRVVAKSQKGKNRISEHGDIWQVLPQPVSPPYPSRHFLQSNKTGYKKWVSFYGDPDFEIHNTL